MRKNKFSIITIVLNEENTIKKTIKSVLSQSYPEIEYIIVDGGSTDNTLKIINEYKDKIDKIIIGQDSSPYDGMNIGIKAATGDIIGLLHAGDLFFNDFVIEDINIIFNKNNVEAVYGDLEYFHPNNQKKVVRKWHSGKFSKNKIKKGWMPPHPTVYMKKGIYNKHGGFRSDLKIAADYELMLRIFYLHSIKPMYIEKTLIRMQSGGRSNKNIFNILLSNYEVWKSWKINGLEVSSLIVLRKIFSKIIQLL